MLAPDALLKLALAYSEATRLSLCVVSRRACGGNEKAFLRLTKGQSINARTIEAGERWFRANWPENAAWPADVPGKPRTRVPAVLSRLAARETAKGQPPIASS